MLIQELIVENFMSYEYARVPFKKGVNVIGGPNGAGKSSLLLAISVGLGQTSTERSRKLSDLIRWGQDQARVTLILDNSKQGNRRPEPKYNKDQLFLTRVLRRDGKYLFELENRNASKQDVERLLGKFGVDPDNMLIIMHQNMVEQFSVLSNVDKLRMVEDAVGLEPFRENVLQRQNQANPHFKPRRIRRQTPRTSAADPQLLAGTVREVPREKAAAAQTALFGPRIGLGRS